MATTTTNKAMSRPQFLADVIAGKPMTAEHIAVATAWQEALAKKSPSKAKVDNSAHIQNILGVMQSGTGYTAAEMAAILNRADPDAEPLSSNKLTSVFGEMVAAGLAVKAKVAKHMTYFLADENAPAPIAVAGEDE